MDGRHYKNPPRIPGIHYPIDRTESVANSEKEAAYVAAYEAFQRGERKCPSRWEFGVSRDFANNHFAAIAKAEGNQ
jgi:hypothetical protein